eukprot:8929712-Ditylum_brightwellii.AAC.1
MMSSGKPKTKKDDPIDPMDRYDSLDVDILGSDDEDEKKDETLDRRKLKKKLRGEEEDKKKPYMLFDFRRGARRWPDNVQIIDHAKAMEMTEAALKEVEEAAVHNAKMKEEEQETKGKTDNKNDANKKEQDLND